MKPKLGDIHTLETHFPRDENGKLLSPADVPIPCPDPGWIFVARCPEDLVLDEGDDAGAPPPSEPS